MAFTVEQGGDSFQVGALSYRDQTIEEFYSYGNPDGASANTPTGLEESDVSQLFLYEGPNGTSLVIIHDKPNDGSGGDVRFDFDTLPASGSWVVKDDGGEEYRRTRAVWGWVDCCTDGGAYRGGFDGEFTLTVTPSFNAGIDTWQFLSGSASDPDRHTLDVGQPVTISPGTGSVSTTVTTLSFLPGGSENSSEGGNPLDSALVQLFRPDETFTFEVDLGIFGSVRAEVTTTPVLDNWLTGDMIGPDDLPRRLSRLEADQEKYEETSDVEGHLFRLRNDAEVSFRTAPDGGIVRDSIDVTFDGISSASVLEGETLNTIDDDVTSDDGVVDGGHRPRYYNQDVISVDETEAVRLSTVFGGYTRVAVQVLDLIRSQPLGSLDFFTDELEWEVDVTGPDVADEIAEAVVASFFSSLTALLATVPNIYTWLEIVVTGDGATFVRLWDASKFPQHTVYLGGDRRETTELSFAPRERCNTNLFAFFGEAAVGIGPYTGSHQLYETYVENRPFVGRVGSWIDDQLDDLPCSVDTAYSSLLPPAGSPMAAFSSEEHTGDEIEQLLPSSPLSPFDQLVSHGP